MREVREEKGEEKQNLTRWDNVETLKMKNVPAKKRKGPTLHHIVFLAIVLFSVFSIVVQSSLSIYKHRMDNGKAISLIPTAQKELGPCHAEVGVEMTRRTALETLEEAAGEECITSEKWKFVFVATNSVISRAVSTFLHASLCVTNSPCDLKASSCQGIWKNRRDFFYFSFVSSPFFFSHLSWSSSAPSGVSFAQWLEGKVALGNQSLLQSSLILSKANCTRVDFIGRLEDMEVHGPKLLLRIRSASANASLSVTEQEMQQGINASSNVSLELLPQLISCRLATRQLSHQQLQTLTALYSRDFEVLGYDKDDAKYVDRVKHTCFKEIERSCALTACSQGDSPATAYAGILRPTTSRDRLRGPRFDFIPQCVISPRYRFIYVHVLKSGGTSWHELFREALCFRHGKQGCPKDEITYLACAKAFSTYPDFFRFSLVREPIGRAMSAYLMAILPRFRGKHIVSFERWAKNQSELDTTVFKMHWIPQYNFLFTNRGCPVVDFVGQLENVEDDVRYILYRIGEPQLISYFETSGFPTTNKARNASTDEKLRKLPRDVKEAIYQQYENDFTAFGYKLS